MRGTMGTKDPIKQLENQVKKRIRDRENGDLIEFSGKLKRETEKAFLVFDGINSHWLPKSQCDKLRKDLFLVPAWLAKEKGIIK